MDRSTESRVRARLTALEEGYDVHVGCGGEVTGGVCQACDKRPTHSDVCTAYSLEDQGTAELLAHTYARDVGSLLREVERLRTAIKGVVDGSGYSGEISLPGLAAEGSIDWGNCSYPSDDGRLGYVQGWENAHRGIASELEEVLNQLETLSDTQQVADEDRVCSHCQSSQCLGCSWDSCEGGASCPGCADVMANGLPEGEL